MPHRHMYGLHTYRGPRWLIHRTHSDDPRDWFLRYKHRPAWYSIDDWRGRLLTERARPGRYHHRRRWRLARRAFPHLPEQYADEDQLEHYWRLACRKRRIEEAGRAP